MVFGAPSCTISCLPDKDCVCDISTLFQVTKPLLERKRRARINKCLDELKDLMVGALEVGNSNNLHCSWVSSSSRLKHTDTSIQSMGFRGSHCLHA